MNQQLLTSFIRHGLTAFGGGFIASGSVDSNQLELISGALATLLGVAWSIIEKRKNKQP